MDNQPLLNEYYKLLAEIDSLDDSSRYKELGVLEETLRALWKRTRKERDE